MNKPFASTPIGELISLREYNWILEMRRHGIAPPERPAICENLYKSPSGAFRNEALPEGFRIQNNIFAADKPGRLLCVVTARTYAEADYYGRAIIAYEGALSDGKNGS